MAKPIQRGERTWLLRIFLGRDPNGKRRFLNKTVHGTKRDAIREQTRLTRDRDIGTTVLPSRQTVGSFLGEWIDVIAKARVRPVTHLSYAAWLNRHVIPVIGHIRLSSLTTTDVQQLYNRLTALGLSPRSVRYVHAILRSALDHAVRTNLIPRNPAGNKLCTLPRQVRKEMKALNPEQARQFIGAAQGDEWVALWTLLITTGLRPGEAMGLKWGDLKGNRLAVQRALVWGYKGSWTLAEPKTPKARRTVLLPESAIQ
ncbi:MAG: site-specific integrase, partial [Gemmatimonadota bacterium]|nr:site-specific integrase [Gemmatimonadota bacterium]